MSALAKRYLDAAKRLDHQSANRTNGVCDAIFDVFSSTKMAERAGPLLSEMYAKDARLFGPWEVYWGANFGATYEHTGTYGNWEIDL